MRRRGRYAPVIPGSFTDLVKHEQAVCSAIRVVPQSVSDLCLFESKEIKVFSCITALPDKILSERSGVMLSAVPETEVENDFKWL